MILHSFDPPTCSPGELTKAAPRREAPGSSIAASMTPSLGTDQRGRIMFAAVGVLSNTRM